MNIAILVHSIQDGGMEHVAAQMSEMLSGAGHKVYIIVSGFDRGKAYAYTGKIVVEPFHLLKTGQSLGKDIEMMFYNVYLAAKVKKRYKIDATISFAPEMNMVNMFSGIRDKKILTIHNCLSESHELGRLYNKRITYKIYNYSYKVVTVSRWCRKDMIQNYGVKKNKVEVIYNPVRNDGVLGINIKKENVVLIVGRLQDEKQQWHIIRAFKMVLDEIQDAKLIIAGKGENMKYLQKLCIDSGMSDRVFFKGFVKEIDKLYQQAKCVVISSASESFSCAAVEAMSKGVPVVAADCPGGIKEVITGKQECNLKINQLTIVKGGVITPRLDGIKYGADEPVTEAECELAKGMIYFLKNEEKYLEIASNCIEIGKLFNEDVIKKKWLNLLENMEK